MLLSIVLGSSKIDKMVSRTLHQASFPGIDVIYREAGSQAIQQEEVGWSPRSYEVIWLLLGRALRKERKKSMVRKLSSSGHSWGTAWLTGKKEESCVLWG